jgi:hypothetical protein
VAKQPPPARDVPINVGFAIPYADLYHATRRLLADVARAEDDAKENIAEIRQELGIAAECSPTPVVELYVAAVQVFAAMTLEAAIDLYAILRFGEMNARAHFRQKPIWKRLQTLLTAATGIRPEDDAVILGIVRSIFEARNALVHPKSIETEYDREGRPTSSQTMELFPWLDGDMARSTVLDLDRFFDEICRVDPKVFGVLHAW